MTDWGLMVAFIFFKTYLQLCCNQLFHCFGSDAFLHEITFWCAPVPPFH